MDEHTQPLLVNEEIVDDPRSGEASHEALVSTGLPPTAPKAITPKGRTVIVEPVMFFFCLGVLGNDPLLQQYTHSRFASHFPVLHNTTVAGNDSSKSCSATNSSNPYVIAQMLVNEDTSVWQTYLALPALLSMITSVIFGAYSDHIGRRPIIILPCICALIKYTVNAFVIYFNLPLYLLIIAGFTEAAGGGFYTLITVLYSYLADITTQERLGIRMTIADSIMALAAAICIVALGFSIKNVGFFYTYLMLAGSLLINLVYVIFFVPETIVRDKTKTFSIVGHLKSIVATFTNKEDQRHIKIFLLLLAYLFCNFIVQSQGALQILFAMGPPLCWGAVTIGVYFGATTIFLQIAGITGLTLFEWCKIPEITVAVIGIVSIAIGCLVNAFANCLPMMVLAAMGAMFFLLPPAMIRTCASVMFKDDEQGRMLSGFSSIGAFGYVFSMMMMNTIYQNTVDFMEGFVFLVYAGFCLLCLIVLVIFIVFIKKERRMREAKDSERTGFVNEAI